MISKPMPIDPSEREYLKAENEQLRADLAQAQKEIERLKESVAENKADEEDAKINYQRWRDCEAERDTLQARVEQLEEKLADMEAIEDSQHRAVIQNEELRDKNAALEQQVAALSKPVTPVVDALCRLAETTEGETRALVEVLSCRLGYGHVVDLFASRSTAGSGEAQSQGDGE